MATRRISTQQPTSPTGGAFSPSPNGEYAVSAGELGRGAAARPGRMPRSGRSQAPSAGGGTSDLRRQRPEEVPPLSTPGPGHSNSSTLRVRSQPGPQPALAHIGDDPPRSRGFDTGPPLSPSRRSPRAEVSQADQTWPHHRAPCVSPSNGPTGGLPCELSTGGPLIPTTAKAFAGQPSHRSHP